MAEIPPLPLSPSPPEATPGGHGAAQLVYVLFGVAAITAILAHGLPVIAPLFGIVGIVAIIIAYVKAGDAQGTYVASHFRWLIRTFWFSLLWAVVGALLFITLIGIPVALLIWLADCIWVIYRVVRGYLLFKEARAVPGM